MESPVLEKLYELSRDLKKAKTTKTILKVVTDHLPKALGAKNCTLFIKNPVSGDLELKAHNHPNIGEDPFIRVADDQESIMNMVIAQNTSLLVKNIEEEIGVPNKTKYNSKSFMCLIINDSKKTIGILNLSDKSPNGFNREDMLLSSIIAELLGAFLGRLDLNKI